MKYLSFATLIFGLWVILSGHFDPLLLSLGLLSTMLTVYLARRMDLVDEEGHPIHQSIRIFRFQFFMAREIFMANLEVAQLILRGRESISPRMVVLDVHQRTCLGRVILANSITLTPGTVCVCLKKHQALVHALSKESAEALLSGRLAHAVPDHPEEARK